MTRSWRWRRLICSVGMIRETGTIFRAPHIWAAAFGLRPFFSCLETEERKIDRTQPVATGADLCISVV